MPEPALARSIASLNMDAKSKKSYLSVIKGSSLRFAFALAGLLSLIWFLIRVVPKPSRAAYPCQRVAAPLASGFLVWLLGLVGSTGLLYRAKHHLQKSRYVVAVMCLAGAVFALWWSAGMSGESAKAGTFTPIDLPNSPIGTARGIHPGRVVWVHDPNATSWDGTTGYWSDNNNIDQNVVSAMFSTSVCWLTGEVNDTSAWDRLFEYFNERAGKGKVVYQSGEKIAVKVNMAICSDHGNPGNASYNSPQLVWALLNQLVNNAGVAPSDITVYDASRFIPSTIYDRCSVGDLAGVRFVDSVGGDGRIEAQRDPNVRVYHADPNVPARWLPDCVVEAEYIINLAHLKGHYLTGVTLCAKNHFGSTWVEADGRYGGWRGREGFWPGNDIHYRINAYDTNQPGSLSSFKAPARPMGSYNPLVELMGHEHLGGKTVLFIIDGLYAAKHQGATIGDSPKWLSSPFNNDWTSSIFVSQDGVAVDSVAVDFLRSEPTVTDVADANDYSTADDYLHEAAVAHDPCSGTLYDPDGEGRLESLGVHEHWNNATDKQYSRNLRTSGGVELVSSAPAEAIPGDFEPDGDVDLFDLAVLTGHWLEPVQPCWNGDLTNDSQVNMLDFAILAENWTR
ncbi:MAG: DUF362 domain-containing protein [Planctomycetota bacterium]